MAGRVAAWTSARNLLWLLLIATGSGILLVVPVAFLPTGLVPAPAESILRAVHSFSSVVLVAFALIHAARRIFVRRVRLDAVLSGSTSSLTVGIAAVTGFLLVEPGRWFEGLGAGLARTAEHAAAIVHYGYSAALSFAVVYWHIRPRSKSTLVPLDAAARDVVVATLLVGILLAPTARDGHAATTDVLAPEPGWLSAWSVVVPIVLGALAWMVAAARGATKLDRSEPNASLQEEPRYGRP